MDFLFGVKKEACYERLLQEGRNDFWSFFESNKKVT